MKVKSTAAVNIQDSLILDSKTDTADPRPNMEM